MPTRTEPMLNKPRSPSMVGCLSLCSLSLWLCACGVRDESRTVAPIARPSRPDVAVLVAAGEDLQARIDAAPSDAVLELGPGRHAGPIVLKRAITLWSDAGAVVTGGGGGGCTVMVDGPNVRLLGLTVDGSGGRFDLLDAAIRVHGDDAVVEGVTIRNALFGILVEKVSRATIRGNLVQGTGDAALGLRGDTIRLWETQDSIVEGNVVRDGRDMVVWYSNRTRVLRNEVSGGRYGTHFMYSREQLVEGNRYAGNVVGVFVMYSHDLELRSNTISRCSGASGIGIGLKESGNVKLLRNRLIANTIGIFIDTSPLDVGEHDHIEGNLVALGRTAIAFHGGAARNVFTGNVFRDNQQQVRVDGGSDALAAEWAGNQWDDYAGYDLDGDGFGDVPYEIASLVGQLTSKRPALEFFSGTPTLFLVELTGRVMPIFEPQVLVRDSHPAVALEEVSDAR
ncbi:MAG: nitrous oxide reductase family maturation protein NosD [Planctomycetes bacterium]|nr:nitrous oxide reductase family maturation protein NosD [Planctomycetota bacterium]